MSDIEIHHVDSVSLKVLCDRSVAKELSGFFTFSVPNYQYTPAYKNKLWDGQIRLYNMHSATIYAGLLDYVLKFAQDRNYTVDYTAPATSHTTTKKNTEKFINEFVKPTVGGKDITPHEHQINSVTHAINNDRCLLLSPTGSGKSLIIYSLLRYYESVIAEDKQILVIVPTTGLVTQMYNDFKDYSSKTNWSAEDKCHMIFSGRDKNTNKKVIITTWQSIYKMPEKYFSNFSVVFGDECHLFKAKSLTSLMTKLKDCPYRIGTTGTLDGTATHKLVIEGLFGRVYNVTTTKTLMEKDLLSDIDIDCLVVQYTDEEIQETKRVTYQEEIKWIVANKKRNEFIKKLSCGITGNTLLLFNYVELHGKPLYDLITKACPDKKVFFIYGETDAAEREEIRNIVDREKNAVLVASYGTCSTGINIKNINNIIFASPSKSVIRILQSIGRGLRRTQEKNKVKLYDISDDLCYKKYRNHTMKHLDERIKIYTKENFEFKLLNIQI